MKKTVRENSVIQRLATFPLIKQMVYQAEVYPGRVLFMYCPALLVFTFVISNIGSWAFAAGNGTLSGICASISVLILIAVTMTALVVWWKLYR